MADVTDLIEDSPKGPSRRNVIAGAAWGAPVVLGVGLSPDVAASGPVPIITSSSLTGARGTSSTKKVVSFTWTFSTSFAITGVSVTIGTVTGGTFSTVAVVGSVVTFTFTNTSSSTTSVPAFTLSVGFTYQGSKSASFGVAARNVADGTSETFSVTPSLTNPVA